MDIAIAGMGMGGLAAACFLARDGHKVTIYDQIAKAGPVGSGFVLQPTGLIILDQLGLLEETEKRGQRIDRMHGKLSKNQKTVLDVNYRGNEYGVAVIRWALFDILYNEALKYDVSLEMGAKVEDVIFGEKPRIQFSNGQLSPTYDLVIDALGLRSPLRKAKGKELKYGALWLNLPWRDDAGFDEFTLAQRYDKAKTMIGVLPLGKAASDKPAMTTFFWSLCHQDYDAWQKGGIEKWVETVCSYWPEVAPFLEPIDDYKDQITHARYRHHTHVNPIERGFARIGDSWHATSPQLGQGANMALLDAAALARALQTKSDVSDALKNYRNRRWMHLMFYQTLSKYLTSFYQSDNSTLPFLRDYLIAPTLRRKGLVHAMVRTMVTGKMLNPIKSTLR